MLAVIIAVKSISEVALLALLGQWLLGSLAGTRRDNNVFNRILQIIGKPFVIAARVLAPRFVLERHLPLVAFLLLAFVWRGVTILKIQLCLRVGVQSCQ